MKMDMAYVYLTLESTFPNLPRDTCIAKSMFNDFVVFDVHSRGDGGLTLWLSYGEYHRGMFVCVQISERVQLSITSIEELDQFIYTHLWSVEGGLRDKLLKLWR